MDRNLEQLAEECSELASLSARRAWIEMLYGGNMKLYCAGRSPQGERG